MLEGIEPGTFWTLTLGELGAILRRSEHQDRAAWIHTGQMLAMTANVNRGRNSKSYSWTDFVPYDYTPPAEAPEPVTAENFEQGKRWAGAFKN